ncbi:asparagine synthase-related protein [Streptomyces sp. NPDC050617]|uniref:asparagine synthetase B family protein n=1 Tax=Streptomyces sp. NPDC050617 TaxID=3154628 RepID=UPI00342287D1
MVRRLAASLVHRGRSGEGAYADELVSLHSARHAVIAIEEARQPLRDCDGVYTMVGNGEVLNYREMATRLPSERRRRLPPGDLQVALELFAARGADGFEPLRGPFALAVWDGDELTLVRDRLGERPLYYYETPDLFVFASEVRCLESALRGRLALDEASVLSFVGLGRMTGDRTLYKEIKSVAPGEVLQIKGDRVRRRQLAPVPDLYDASRSPGDEAGVRRLIEQANHRMLVADCPVAVGFSGGVDSTVVLKAALEGADVAAAITLFSERGPGIDENLRRARAVAKVMGVDLIEVPFTIPSLDDTVALLDETLDMPAAEPLVLHNNALHTVARDYARVLLGGHGADEVFGGYDRYTALKDDANHAATSEWMSASPWERWRRTAGWKAFVAEWAGEAFASQAAFAYADSDHADFAHTDLSRADLTPTGSSSSDLTHTGSNHAGFAYADFKTTDALDRPFPYEFAENSDPVLFGQALDLFRLMTYDNFRATDENGIARGVEVRSPFFDLDLIAGVYALPVHRRIVPHTKKHLLQRTLHGTPMQDMFAARKVGFDDAFSYSDWMSENWPEFSSTITTGPLAELSVVRASLLQRLSELDWRLLWRLFSLTAWLKRRERF